jgi:hypothetical protein
MRLFTALMLFSLLPGNDRLDDLKRKFQRSLHEAEGTPLSDRFGRKGGTVGSLRFPAALIGMVMGGPASVFPTSRILLTI